MSAPDISRAEELADDLEHVAARRSERTNDGIQEMHDAAATLRALRAALDAAERERDDYREGARAEAMLTNQMKAELDKTRGTLNQLFKEHADMIAQRDEAQRWAENWEHEAKRADATGYARGEGGE